MNTKTKTIAVFLLLILTLMLTVPVFADGEDPDDEHTATQVPDDDHADEEDAHADGGDDHADGEDDHGDSGGNTTIIIGGIIGAALLAAGAAFLFSPRPSMLTLIGLALIGATGVIHLIVGANWGDTLLLLNGIGYLGLGVLWAYPNQLIPNQKRILAIVLAIYTLITILGYFLTHDHYDFTAILTKVIEVPLLILLAVSAFSTEKTEQKNNG